MKKKLRERTASKPKSGTTTAKIMILKSDTSVESLTRDRRTIPYRAPSIMKMVLVVEAV